MARVGFTLQQLLDAACQDEPLRLALLSTRSEKDPMASFCRIATEAGYSITVGELFAVGQEYSDNQCKSTNGGNPNPYDGLDDAYENFMTGLENFSRQ